MSPANENINNKQWETYQCHISLIKADKMFPFLISRRPLALCSLCLLYNPAPLLIAPYCK